MVDWWGITPIAGTVRGCTRWLYTTVVDYLICGLIKTKLILKQSKQILHNRIADIALQNWYTEVFTSSMCTIYRRFKKQLDFENYLMSANPRERISMTKYRCQIAGYQCIVKSTCMIQKHVPYVTSKLLVMNIITH